MQKKYTMFLSAVGFAPSQLQISDYAPESNHAFGQLISMLQEFFPTLRFKSLDFHQNKPKFRLFLRKTSKFSSFWGSIPKPQ